MFTFVPRNSRKAAGEWAILGETNKWVSVSPDRFEHLVRTPDYAEIKMAGSDEEEVEIGFVSPSGVIITVRCIFDTKQELTVRIHSLDNYKCL